MATATSALTSATSTETCTHPQPGKNGYLPPEACDAVLMYVPSFAAAVLFCVLFGFTTICHLVQAVIYKKVASPLPADSCLRPATMLTTRRGTPG